jgi:hypothetical protein
MITQWVESPSKSPKLIRKEAFIILL